MITAVLFPLRKLVKRILARICSRALKHTKELKFASPNNFSWSLFLLIHFLYHTSLPNCLFWMSCWKANQQHLRSAWAPSCGAWKSLVKVEALSPPLGEFVIKPLSLREGEVPSLSHPHQEDSPHFKPCCSRDYLWLSESILEPLLCIKYKFYKLNCNSKCLSFALLSLHFTKCIHTTLFHCTQ